MKVKLIAHTKVDTEALSDLGFDRDTEWDEWGPLINTDADDLAEFAGRNCYRSFHRPNPATAANDDYLEHILDVGHESVLEHASATFYIEASRSVLTELERHRHLSFSVVSQRYVDALDLNTELPPALRELPEADFQEAAALMVMADTRARADYTQLVRIFQRNGLPRKRAREAARAVLPNMTSSPMVVTANHRAWRYVIKHRWHEAADAEIRELAGLLLKELRQIAPNTYQDIPETPYR